MFKRGNIRETMGRLVSKFFIYDNVPPNKASSHHFNNIIFNFMVNSKGSTVFLKSLDVSNKIKDHRSIYDLLKEVVKVIESTSLVIT
ncbi:hypothetical protein ACOSP7_016829 [Xanthoceras sorbifolium]